MTDCPTPVITLLPGVVPNVTALLHVPAVTVPHPDAFAGSVSVPTVPGPPGPPGVRGSWWWQSPGAPGAVIGALGHDLYLDTVTGDVWAYVPPEGAPAGNYGADPYGTGEYGG